MNDFLQQIARFEPSLKAAAERRWIYVPYDRLHDGVGPLAGARPEDVVVVLMESAAKGTRRPYHKKKLTLVLSSMRHFALEQAERGCRIVYGTSPAGFGDGLLELQNRWQWKELWVNRPAERELRVDLEAARLGGLRLREAEDTAWLSTTEDFEAAFGAFDPGATGRQYLMDKFYRAMRRKSGVLMRNGKPIGGKWSYDAENRKPYRSEVPVPERPRFAPDAITREVMQLVEHRHTDHFGRLEGFDLAVTRTDAEAVWAFALEKLLPHFGPWEDAMSCGEPEMFHSVTSPLLNLTRIRPADVVQQAAEAYEAGKVPLESAEGFIRQLIGWREFMRHIHEATDGFRKLEASGAPSYLEAHARLPPVYWGVKSGMRCMDTVVEQVIDTGWSHHITRLMVLSNLATLCGYSPRELTDWFWMGYVDAYDWVVEPNVLGMATFADGGLTATKPYVSGSSYINRMSDFCSGCALDPKRSTGPGSCPFTSMYWSFLERNQDKLKRNLRMAMPMRSMQGKSATERQALRERAEAAMAQLSAGKIVD